MKKFCQKKYWSSEKELSDINFKRLKSNNNLPLTAYSFIDINNITTGSNKITIRKVHVKPSGYDDLMIYCYNIMI